MQHHFKRQGRCRATDPREASAPSRYNYPLHKLNISRFRNLALDMGNGKSMISQMHFRHTFAPDQPGHLVKIQKNLKNLKRVGGALSANRRHIA